MDSSPENLLKELNNTIDRLLKSLEDNSVHNMLFEYVSFKFASLATYFVNSMNCKIQYWLDYKGLFMKALQNKFENIFVIHSF